MLKLFKKIYRFVKKPIIVFSSFSGKGYGLNPKYIAEEILKQKLPYRLVWLLENNIPAINIPSKIKIVKFKPKRSIKWLKKADVWIFNNRNKKLIEHGLIKDEKQLYIQTWHGSLGFKKIEKDIEQNKNYEGYLKAAKIDSKMIDYLLSPSAFDTKCLKNCFYYDGKIIEVGYPENDIFFYPTIQKEKIISKVKKNYNISDDKKIVLYAPTFRDSHNIDIYNINTNKIISTLKDKFNSEWVFIKKLHPNLLKENAKFNQIDSINATDYPDLQELLLASDILITDYSSAIWNFCLQDKPAFIYAPDIEMYTRERDFYIPIYDMPFEIAQTIDELIEKVKKSNIDDYILKIHDFMKKRKGHFDKGKASENVVQIIKEYINDRDYAASSLKALLPLCLMPINFC